MKRFVLALTVTMMALALASSARAQAKEIPGSTSTATGIVEAVDYSARVVSFRNEAGEIITVDVPEENTRLSEIKVGDKIVVRYYDNVTVRLKAPGEKDVNTHAQAETKGTGARPGGTVAEQRTMTATIQAIDPKVPSITFVGPNGWKYSRKVQDKSILGKIKVGDKVDFTWTTAYLINIEAKK